MATKLCGVTIHFTNGDQYDELEYVPNNQKCPEVISDFADMMRVGGVTYKVYHETDQNVDVVKHVEAAIFVDDLDNAVASVDLGYVIGEQSDQKVIVTGDGVTITLVQWRAPLDISLDDTITCGSVDD